MFFGILRAINVFFSNPTNELWLFVTFVRTLNVFAQCTYELLLHVRLHYWLSGNYLHLVNRLIYNCVYLIVNTINKETSSIFYLQLLLPNRDHRGIDRGTTKAATAIENHN